MHCIGNWGRSDLLCPLSFGWRIWGDGGVYFGGIWGPWGIFDRFGIGDITLHLHSGGIWGVFERSEMGPIMPHYGGTLHLSSVFCLLEMIFFVLWVAADHRGSSLLFSS